MILTSRTKGTNYVPKERKKLIGYEETIEPNGIAKWEQEQPISSSLKVSDYTLRTQLENGTFLNQEMPKTQYGDRLETANIDSLMEDIKVNEQLEQAKQNTTTKEGE